MSWFPEFSLLVLPRTHHGEVGQQVPQNLYFYFKFKFSYFSLHLLAYQMMSIIVKVCFFHMPRGCWEEGKNLRHMFLYCAFFNVDRVTKTKCKRFNMVCVISSNICVLTSIMIHNTLRYTMSFSYEALDDEIENMSSQSTFDSGLSAFDSSRSTNTIVSSNKGGNYFNQLCDAKIKSKYSTCVRDRRFNTQSPIDWTHERCVMRL